MLDVLDASAAADPIRRTAGVEVIVREWPEGELPTGDTPPDIWLVT
jgi:hypothetical protein